MNSTSTYLIISAIAALLLGILKIMYSSKCSKINCCFDAIDITRYIVSELEEDKYKIAMDYIAECREQPLDLTPESSP